MSLKKTGPLDIEKPPAQWEMDLNIRVLDPDGWREAGKPYHEPVTLPEFRALCETSTIRVNDNALWG